MLRPHKLANNLLGLGNNPGVYSSLSDGISYWKGKKIISLEQWNKIRKPKDRLESFPDEYQEHPFIFGVPNRIREDAKVWYKNYIELMDFTKNPKYGKRKCRDCLLNPNYDGSYFDLYKFIANALITDANSLSAYPCKVVNFYSCPYDNNQATVTRDNLFKLNQIVEITGRTLSKALDIKGNRIIYKIDFQSGKVQEIDTFLCGNLLYTENLPGGKPIDHKLDVLESIEKLSLIPMDNLDDIFETLTNERKLNIVLQLALDKKYLEYKDELIQFFMSIKSNVRKQDLVLRHLLAHRVEKNRCSICNRPANLNYGKDIWLCMKHLKNIGR